MSGCAPVLPHRMPDVPILESARLRLRGHTLNDFSKTRALWSDASVVRFLGGKPFTEEECWSRFLRYIGHWSLLGFGYWLVEEKNSCIFVGEVGFGNFKRDVEPALASIPELGWVLAADQHGKGYATEAALAALAWGRAQFAPAAFACIIHPDHHASMRVAARCGFEEERRGTYKGSPTILFKLT